MYRRLLSVKEAAELLNLSIVTIYRMVRDGRIKAKRLGDRILIDPETIGIQELFEPPTVESSTIEKSAIPLLDPNYSDIIQELIRSLKSAPAFGEISLRVIFHNSQVVRLENTTSVSKLMKDIK